MIRTGDENQFFALHQCGVEQGLAVLRRDGAVGGAVDDEERLIDALDLADRIETVAEQGSEGKRHEPGDGPRRGGC